MPKVPLTRLPETALKRTELLTLKTSQREAEELALCDLERLRKAGIGTEVSVSTEVISLTCLAGIGKALERSSSCN